MKHLLTERFNRRQIFRIAGGVMLASVFDLHRAPGSQAEMTRMRWVERDVFPQSGTYRSTVFAAEQTFTSVEVGWIADGAADADLAFAVRSSLDGENWSPWRHLHADPHVNPAPGERVYASPLLVGEGNYVQYQVELIASPSGEYPRLREVEIGCVDSNAPASLLNVGGDRIDGWIISRAGWGANEDLRYEDDGDELWPPEHDTVRKIVVHHTATEDGGSDPASMLRAIYYYHAVTLGWGDIGYNYLVDHHGNVYEGRAGGDGSVGGHVFGYNSGSMGIAVIGTFQSIDSAQPALDSIVRIINERAPRIDPGGGGPFHDRAFVPDVCGHRDLVSSDCPGDRLHGRLPEIRGWASGRPPIHDFGAPGPTSGEITHVQFMPQQIHAGSTLRVDVSVRNIGAYTMYTQGPVSRHVYQEDEDFVAVEADRVEGTYRVGLNFDGNGGVPNPWRWGFPDRLDPGESTTVTGFVRLESVGEWNMSVSLIEELVRYHQNGAFPQRIVTLPPPTEPAGQSADPSMHYFEITSHNVPDIFYWYWEQNGGVERFGYPLTEAVMELSDTDGETYLTQYFERARFEHHPEHAGTQYEVLLGLLGSERTAHRLGEEPFRPVDAPPDTDDVDWFFETAHTLRAVFRDYWWDNGGVSIYGFPISEEFEETSMTDGQTYTVQYFERNRFEHHPEHAGTQHEVLLGHLAREILIDRGWLEPGF